MLLLVDKPVGYTSFDVIRKLQKLYPKTKIGHGGTLDPMATGLLIIAIGKDTKKLSQIIGEDKTYITIIDFATYTDTWDYNYHNWIEKYEITQQNGKIGIIKNKHFIPAPSLKEIEEKLKSIIGKHSLPLPPFSAKKIKGKRLYDLARQGEQLNLSKEMEIKNFQILDYSFPYLKLKLDVGKGTYIRSIGYWLGQQFSLGSALAQLSRTRIGKWELENNN